MSYLYAPKKKTSKKTNSELSVSGMEASLPNSAMLEAPGHQVDMPVVMREKMEGAFGMDLSSVKLYENKAVGEAGAEAVAQGSTIAFAPGRLDFSSTRGQALLGHEISHVASQARGEVKGSGLVNDSALEARADREGLMAARGESISSGYGGAAAPLSNVSAASAAGPMQAKSGKKIQDRARADYESANLSSIESDADAELDGLLNVEGHEKVDKLFRLTAAEIRQNGQFRQAIKGKRKELIPKYYEQLKDEAEKKGWSKDKWMENAYDAADDEARNSIKLEDFSTLSDEESAWMHNMYDNSDEDILMEVSRRKNHLAEQLYKQHQAFVAEYPGEDEGKLKAETGYSPIATEYFVYDNILANSRDNQGFNEFADEAHSKLSPEQKRIDEIAQEIASSGVDSNQNNYLMTDEGKEVNDRLYEQQLAWLGELSGKKKHLGRRKK